MANSVESDQMPHSVVSDLALQFAKACPSQYLRLLRNCMNQLKVIKIDPEAEKHFQNSCFLTAWKQTSRPSCSKCR